MSILSGLTKDKEIKDEQDTLGGGYVLESGVYPFRVELAYLNVAASGAIGLVIHLTGDKGEALRQTFWVQSGKAKGSKNYWVNQKGEKSYLPGFNQAEAMCQLLCSTALSDMVSAEKVVQLYNYDAKKEIPTKVEVLTELLGKKLKAGVLKQVVDKNAKGDDGTYHPTGETREENEITKMFDEEGKTLTEQKAGGEAVFIETWAKKFTDTVKDKSKGTSGGSSNVKPGTPKVPVKSLFDETEDKPKEKSAADRESLFDDAD